MRVRFPTSFAALALLVVAPSMAQLPGESEEPQPVAAAAATIATTTADPQAAVSPESGRQLPRTASPLALIALLGAGSAGSALGLRFARRRR